MSNHLFQSFWLQDELPPLEHLCIKSFIAHGHRFRLYSYADVANMPRGCEAADARLVLPEERLFYYESPHHVGSVSAFSNLFRYKLLLEHGGWWVDTDVLCLTPEIPDAEYVFAKESPVLYGTATLRAEAGSLLMGTALSRAEQAGTRFAFGATGSYLLTELIHEFDLENEAWETESIYPVSWTDPLAVFNPGRRAELEQRLASSKFLHLWTTVLRRANVLKSVRPPIGSFLAACFDSYDVEFPDRARYDWHDMQVVDHLFREDDWLRTHVAQLERQLAEAASARAALRSLARVALRRARSIKTKS